MPERILLFHAVPRRYHFRELLRCYLERGAAAAVVCVRSEAHNYRHCIKAGAQHMAFPDFMRAMDFEGDPRERERLEQLVRESERAAGMGANRILLVGERDIGRLYVADQYHWPASALERYCRDDDRRRSVLLRHFAWLERQINEFRPTVMLGNVNCDPMALTAYFLCKLKGIPFCSFRFSKIYSGRAFWTTDRIMNNVRTEEVYRRMLADKHEPSQAACERIDSFRERPDIVDYIRHNWKIMPAGQRLKEHGQIPSLVRDWLRWKRKGSQGWRPEPVWANWRKIYRYMWYEWRHARFYRSLPAEELKKTRYVYYPLHKEPELMLNYKAPLWHHQLHAVKYLSSMLPSGYKLVVREHRGNWGRRYTSWLRAMVGLPGVILVEPFGSQFPYIVNADLVVTDNGSSGWEGLILQKPVVTTETTFYDVLDLARSVADPRTLDQRMMEALETPLPVSPEEHDRRLRTLVDAELATTMPVDEMYENPAMVLDYIDDLLARERSGS